MPGLSISKSQKIFLDSLELDKIGQSKGSVQPVELDEIEQALLSVVALIKVRAEQYLDESNSHSTGHLSMSIQADEVRFFGGAYSLDIRIADYFDYVNKGVNGLVKKHGSPYSFKNMGVGKDMLANVREWVIREGIKVRTNASLKKPVGAERKGKPFSGLKDDEATQAAFVVSKGIKRNGIKPTKFWDRALKDGEKEMKNSFGSVLIPLIVRELSK